MSLRAAFRRTEFKPAIIPTLVALVVVIAGAVFAEQQNRQVYRQQLHADVMSEVAVIRSRLEGNINTNIQLSRGLVSAISTEPDMQQERFTSLARHLFSSDNQLRNVAAAPDMVISMVYPLTGNQQTVGLDYNDLPRQREAAFRVRDTGQFVLAGPVNLVQGGTGFVGRFPVYVEDGRDSKFWGIVSAVIDTEELYAASGLDDAEHLDIALRGTDGRGAAGVQFFGPEGLFDADVVTADVFLPYGTWQIAARPAGGWDASPPNLWIIRGLATLAAGLVVLPVFAAGWLVGERYENLRRLQSSRIELKRVSKRLELALEASQIGVWENEVSKGTLYWDSRIRALFGIGNDEPVTYEDWLNYLHPKDYHRAEREFEQALLHKTPYDSEFRIVRPDGEVRTIRSIGTVIEEADGTLKIIGINNDITADVKLNEDLRRARMLAEARNAELEAAKARIEHNALHDSLTGLPNRRFLDDVLAGKSDIGLDPKSPHGVLHIDLDRFKQINDTLGHAAGDAMLIHAARMLGESVRATDFVARIGGDEFVVLCPQNADRAFLEKLAGELVERMRQPVDYQGRECRFGVSIGIACGTPDLDDPRQLLINADIALYRAKAEGRGRHHFFSEDLHMAAVMTKRLADEIMTGIEQGQFVAHYQGQFDAKSRQICGVEALVRWKHPEKGLLVPRHFLEVAEELNVTGELDRIVLEQALRQARLWEKAGLEIPRVSVNVSARRLHDKSLVAGLKDLDIRPGTVTFELVESIFLDEGSDLLAWNIDQIKELGIGIEIDDFGTGYTSILSLMRLRPERLKIDRQLIYPIAESAAQRDLVESIVRIGASLGIEALAEGVESMEHANILRDIGCTALQGYVFGRPMSGRAFTRFAKSYDPRKAKAA